MLEVSLRPCRTSLYKVALGLLSLPALLGCQTVGSFYIPHIRPASFYVDRYCFELPRARVIKQIEWMLKRYHFPIVRADRTQGRFQTRPVYMRQYSRNPNWGYEIGLQIKVQTYKGAIKRGKLPKWAFQGKQPKLPPYPRRANYPTREAYAKARRAYTQKQLELLRISEQAYRLMKRWQGCDIFTSKLRTIVAIKAQIQAYPIGGFGRLERKRGCQVASDRSLEYAMLRVLAWRLGRLKYIRRMLYDKTPSWQRGPRCIPPKKP